MEIHAEFEPKRKNSKRKKKRDTCENSFRNQRPVEARPCSVPENIQTNSSLEVTEENSLRNSNKEDFSDDSRLAAIVETKDSGLKKVEPLPENKPKSHGAKNNVLISAKEAKQKGKGLSVNYSKNELEAVKGDFCSTSCQTGQRDSSATSSFVEGIIQTDSKKPNCVNTSISSNNTALGEKEFDVLMTNAIANNSSLLSRQSPQVKITYSKRHKKEEVVEDSVRLHIMEKNVKGASTINNLTSLVNKEEVSLTKGVDSTKRMRMPSENNSMNYDDLRKAKRKKEKGRGKGKNDKSESSSLKEVKLVPPSDNMVSAVDKEENIDMEPRVFGEYAEADLLKENESPVISSRTNDVKNVTSMQLGITKENVKSDCSDRIIKSLQGDVVNSSVKHLVPYKRRNRKKKLNNTIPEERGSMNETVEMTSGYLDELKRKSVIDFFEGSFTCFEVSLPHFSGQGTIDGSSLTNKEDSSFRLFEGKEASFSSQVVENAVKNDHYGKTSKSNKRDEEKNEKPSHSVDKALLNNDKFNPVFQQVEQKNEDLNKWQRHGILSKEKITIVNKKVEKLCLPPFDVVSDEVTFDVIDKCKNSDKAPMSPERATLSCTRKKLLVLDLNGLLVDVIYDSRNAHKAAPIKVGGKKVFKRPFCDEFLKFCFDVFDVGIWSSRRKDNVSGIIDFLMRDFKHKMLFCWDQSKCTNTGFNTIENVYKPLVLKELEKLWNKEEPGLPWEKGEYSPSNTLLIDDSPYKALCNPPNTAIFPYPYDFQNEDDNSLGPVGDLRVFLEGLAKADDVQHYVRENPFGQSAITSSNISWKFYLRVFLRTRVIQFQLHDSDSVGRF